MCTPELLDYTAGSALEHHSRLSATRVTMVRHLFVVCYGAHRDLHSFPTRRSSDLLDLAAQHFAARVHERRQAAVPRLEQHRSEEHTSELQSRVDLVCRLLLEKKKVPITGNAAMYANTPTTYRSHPSQSAAANVNVH